jgi:cysteine desulfurase / selenocysteine lyase
LRGTVNRGLHTVGEKSTQAYESARESVGNFIGANNNHEVVFLKNSTEGINLVANSWGDKHITKDDVILLSEAEHNSLLLPWQMLAKRKGAKLAFYSVTPDGFIDYKHANINYSKVKIVCFSYVSNVLGTINDVKSIVKHIQKKSGKNMPKVFVDATQAVGRIDVDCKKLGIDFLVFSAHKMYGPMGLGVLWINQRMFDEIDPYYVGGGTVKEITGNEISFREIPYSLEAGTPNVTGAIGLKAACEYVNKIGIDKVRQHDKDVLKYALKKLSAIKGIDIYGTKDIEKKVAIIAFNILNIPSHDLSSVLDMEGVEVRSGQHCNIPWHKNKKIASSVRASFGIYNFKDDVDQLIVGIKKAQKMFI